MIDCDPTVASITHALEKALNPEFRRSLKGMVNSYQKSGALKEMFGGLSRELTEYDQKGVL